MQATRIVLAAVVSVIFALPTAGQIPDEFTNLEVLPKEIDKRELVGLMRGFAGGLGVRCSHCHVGPDDLQGMDFATDEKRTKRIAREMMRMVEAINASHLAKIEFGRPERLEVACRTCHRGLAIPVPIEEVVRRAIDADGVEAALERYGALRDEHYGSGSYDFSPAPLNGLVERLAGVDRLDDALAVAKYNLDRNPDVSYVRMMLGDVHAARREFKDAIAAYETVLEREPDNGFAARRLQRVRAAAERDGSPQGER